MEPDRSSSCRAVQRPKDSLAIHRALAPMVRCEEPHKGILGRRTYASSSLVMRADRGAA
jgi:hypothetical protein